MAGNLRLKNLARALQTRTEDRVETVLMPTQPTGRGGARNRADRTSDHVTEKQCWMVVDAAQLAIDLGKPFNRFSTIHWNDLGIPDCCAARATGQYIKLASDYLASKGERLRWVWVRENGISKGSHVHILMHIPDAVAPAFFRRWFDWKRRLIARFGDGAKRTGRMPSRPILTERIGRKSSQTEQPEAFEQNLRWVVGYILKGAHPQMVAAIGLYLRPEPGGTIIGKRVACWQERHRSHAHRIASALPTARSG